VKLLVSDDGKTDDDDERMSPFQDSQDDDSNEDGDNDGGDDDDDDDFVVQDDGAAKPELPMAFSLHSHQDMSHDFKVVCQLFVHLAMMPMDERRSFMEEKLKSAGLGL
jgi:Domain of unknown function (DUF4211)